MIARRRRPSRLVLVDAVDQLVEVGRAARRAAGRARRSCAPRCAAAPWWPRRAARGRPRRPRRARPGRPDSGITSNQSPPTPACAGQVAVGDVQGVLLGQAARQQAALQGHRHGVLAGVAAGVVDADRGARDQLLGERPAPPRRRARARSERQKLTTPSTSAPRPQRHGDQRVDAVLHDLRRCAPGPAPASPGRRGRSGIEDGRAGAQAARLGRGAGTNVMPLAHRVQRRVLADAA